MSRDYQADTRTDDPNAGDKRRLKGWEEDLCALVLEEWDNGRRYVSDLERFEEDIYRMFRGERVEKTYDWQSNITLNKIFQVVWTAVSYAVEKIYGAQPVIAIKGQNRRGCIQRELLLEKWGSKDRTFLTIVLLILRGLINGVAIVKKVWVQELIQSQLQGRPMSVPKRDHPHNIVLKNKDIAFDWNLQPGQSITEGRFIIHRELTDLSSLYASKINYINLDKIDYEDATSRSQYLNDHSTEMDRDNLGDPPVSDMYREIEVRERQGLFPVTVSGNKITPVFGIDNIYNSKKSKDVRWMHMIVTVAGYSNPTLIRWEPNPYEEYDYVDAHLYLDPNRWKSMGIAEPIMDYQQAMNDNVNAMFDEIWMNLFPPVVFNKFAQIDWDTIKFSPAQSWLQAGNPNDNIYFHRPSNITSDAWMKHQMFDQEIQLTSSVTPQVQGMGKDKTATVGMMNAQFGMKKLDFLVQMIEQTFLVPSAKMDIRFAQKFAHNLTFLYILGEPFQFDDFMEDYRYEPCASSVVSEEQKEIQIQQDIQLLQILATVQNPNTPAVLNYLVADILRNRNLPQLAKSFDEGYFEPTTPAGNARALNNMFGPGMESNQNATPMSAGERSVRRLQAPPSNMSLQ